MTVKGKLLEHFPTLRPISQQAARYVVDHPNEVVIASMRTLAERAGVQPSTLVRLAQQLGYSGWPDLKDAYASDLGLNSVRYGERARDLGGRSGKSDLVAEIFAAHRRNLDSTQTQNSKSLRAAVAILQRAKTVYVAGFRASFGVAHSFYYAYRLFRDTVQLVEGQGGALEMQMRPVARHDALVAISFAPYSRESVGAINWAKAAGARTVALTDSGASPLALAADTSVLFSATSPSYFPSVAAAIAVTEALLELLVVASGEAAVSQLNRAEQQLFESGAYMQAPGRRSPRDA